MNLELIKHIELLFGSIGVILGLFFSFFLLLTRRKQPKANIFLAIYLLAFSLRIGKSLFHNYFEIDSTLRTIILTLLLSVGPSLWLYTKYLQKPNATQKPSDLLHFAPFFVILLTSWLIPNDGSSNLFGIFYNGLILHMFGYTFFAFWRLLRQKVVDNSEEKNKIKVWLQYFLGVNLFIIVLYFLISELIVSFYIGLSFIFSLTIIFLAIAALKNPFLFRVQTEKYGNSSISEAEVVKQMKHLKTLMEERKPYLDPSLTLSKLSGMIGISVKELSQIINQEEQLNYSQFVSKYRIEEAKYLLTSPSHSKFTIATIAYDSGFNSISSFNAQFKTRMNITAISYRKNYNTS